MTPPSATLAPKDRSTRFEIAAAAGVRQGSRSVTVTAKVASQPAVKTVNVPVTIRTLSFSIPNLPDRTIQAGATDDVEIAINRSGGYDGAVQLSVESSKVVEAASAVVPAGQLGTTLRLAVRDAAASGVEVVTIKAVPTVSGIAEGSVGLKLRIVSFRKVGEFAGHDGAVSALAFDPNGQRFLVGTTSGWIYCWDADRPEKWVWAEIRHAGRVNSLAFSPDGNHSLSGGDDNAVYLLKATNGTVETRLHNNEHTNGVVRVWFARQGSPVPIVDPKQQVKTAPIDLPVSASAGRTVYWDAKSAKPLLCLWKTSIYANNTKTGMRFLNESAGIQAGAAGAHEFGNGLALTGLGGDKLEIYQNKQLRAVASGNGVIKAFAVNGDGTRALVACADEQMRLWEIAGRTAKLAPGFPWKPEGAATEIALASDGTRMIYGGADGSVRLFKLP
ncbi:MAG: WD40 repeat domain-containing protein [Gemmataceae bacterium]